MLVVEPESPRPHRAFRPDSRPDRTFGLGGESVIAPRRAVCRCSPGERHRLSASESRKLRSGLHEGRPRDDVVRRRAESGETLRNGIA